MYMVSSPPPSTERSRNLSPSNQETVGSIPRSEDKKVGVGERTTQVASSTPDVDAYRETIFGSATVSAPSASYTYMEREQRINDFAKRVVARVKHIDSGREGEKSFKFQSARVFMEPAGYFSGGLLAAGYDPHKKITVTFNAYVGKGHAEHLTSTEKHTYSAWEIAAGALDHDKPARGGVLNFHSMVIAPENKNEVSDLQALGKKLQHHWTQDIAAPMRNPSGPLAKISGASDAYVLIGTLQSLAGDKKSFENLSPEGRAAVNRTLNNNGQVIIPNLYGYPLEGYAFIPYTPYDGDYNNHRPNKGVMVDLRHGGVREINGDQAFVSWARDNRDSVLRSFNAQDRQGGKDAHWPKAGDVLHNLISGVSAHYPGRHNFFSDESVPVLELFNYTRSRDSDYGLKYSTLSNRIAANFQAVNARNAVWSDQTEVFGSTSQNWKSAKELWGNTFGYVPIVGNLGNIVFGIRDSLDGMTAEDRVGGGAAAVISALQLIHEVGPQVAEGSLSEPAVVFNPGNNYRWRYSAQNKSFDLVRASEAPKTPNKVPVNAQVTPIVKPAAEGPSSFPGMKQIEFQGREYFVTEHPDQTDKVSFLLRRRDPNDPGKLVSSGKIAKPNNAGVWTREDRVGGQRPEFVLLKERIAGTTTQKPASPDQILELNLLPDGRYALQVQDPRHVGKFALRDGAYAFVIRADEPDKVYVGSMDKGFTPAGQPYRFNHRRSPQWVEGHSALSNGLRSIKKGTTDLLFAGTIYVNKGKPEFWTNASGHYQPPAELRTTNLTPAVKSILPEAAFVEEDEMTRAQRKAWHDATHLTQEEKDSFDEFMNLKYATNDSGNDISDDED